MQEYRLNILDRSGRIIDVFTPTCVSDEAAYDMAERLANGRMVDIYRGDKWIALVDGKDPLRVTYTHTPVWAR